MKLSLKVLFLFRQVIYMQTDTLIWILLIPVDSASGSASGVDVVESS